MTVQEVLKQSGMTDEQIAALAPAALTGFNTMVTTAESAKEASELALRAQRDLYDTEIAPGLDRWANEKAQLEATAAFYKAQAEAGKAGGFIPADAPGYVAATPPRNPAGQFVEGQNQVPGSPAFMASIDQKMANGFSNMSWAMQEYARVNKGEFLPDDVQQLAVEAAQQKMPFRDYVNKKYDFPAKREAATKAAEQARVDAAVKEAVTTKEREWTERAGSNPNVRQAETSRFAQMEKAVKAGERPNPLQMTREQRHQNTAQAIRKDIAEAVN